MKGCSDISNKQLELAHFLTLFCNIAFKISKSTAILSYNDIFHGLSGNLNGLIPATYESKERNSKNALNKLRIKNLNRVPISQITITSFKNKLELLSYQKQF